MIGRLKGKPDFLNPGQVIIETSGVGYLVNISYNTYYRISIAEGDIELLIHTYVREDNISLYGFASNLEKGLFLHLISISGIGPRLAINMLSGISSDELLDAVRSASVDRLVAIPGVGRKTAERIIIELRDKLKNLKSDEQYFGTVTELESGIKSDLLSALINLGYKKKDVEGVISKVLLTIDNSEDFEKILKQCLSELSGGVIT
ncbi:MAG: Holliday junction branch migration protein RuvA [Acidobacteria bacterium]|nr:Holliday junction branch migration protein RuvA [Acidobacteriota bacterium]